MEYKIKIHHNESENDILKLVNFYRQMLYYYDENVVASTVTIENVDLLKEIISPELFAQRIGLIIFDKKAEDKNPTISIKNDSNEVIPIYSKDLNFKDVDTGELIGPLIQNQIIMYLPACKNINLTIRFQKGRGIDNAKFNSISGFSYEILDKSTILLRFESQTDVKTILEKMNEALKKELENGITE